MDIPAVFASTAYKNRLERNKDLFPYLTLRTGVTAEYFFEARGKEELAGVLSASLKAGIPFLLIGGGSNIAVTKSNLPGLVVKNSYMKMEEAGQDKENVRLLLSSGMPMSRVVAETVAKGWEGFEYHKGLPGSVGGAVFMNSKWTRPWTYVGDNLEKALLLDRKGEVKEVGRDYFRFAYDYSYLQDTGEVFIEGIFRLRKSDPAVLKQRAEEAIAYRGKTQPQGVATCGCFFRNIPVEDKERLGLPTTSAGFLIDQSGMKNAVVGDFAVSGVHANFIVNNGKHEGATADLLQLIGQVKAKVKEKYGITLHEEVVII